MGRGGVPRRAGRSGGTPGRTRQRWAVRAEGSGAGFQIGRPGRGAPGRESRLEGPGGELRGGGVADWGGRGSGRGLRGGGADCEVRAGSSGAGVSRCVTRAGVPGAEPTVRSERGIPARDDR